MVIPMQLQEYLQELNKIELLGRAEELALWQAYKDSGDARARKKLIEAYQPLVFKVASPFRQQENIMDILQEGTVGLIEAVENFDYQRGVAFSIYASYRIRGRMQDFLQQEGMADIACLDNGNDNYRLEMIADDMENIKNDWNKLVPEWDARDTFFKDINKQQSVYTDYYYGY